MICRVVFVQALFFLQASAARTRLGTTASCDYECGETEVGVEWEDEKGSHEVAFQIGAGKGVDYKPGQSQCLSRCQVLSLTGESKGMSCGKLHKRSVKVSKSANSKLCCVPKQCHFAPETNTYSRHAKGDQDLARYTPWRSHGQLEEIKGNTMASRSCLCCNKERDEIIWGPDVKKFCKMAYSTGNTLGIRDGVRFLTLRASDAVSRSRCRKYCSSYDEFKYGMRSKEKRTLIAHIVKPKGKDAKTPEKLEEDAGSEDEE